ncbi:hypothetical protein L873DRAFT_1821373 [Choiromyces venosus 120613-1]|uniref:Uncharacterized protein n=1 Tax=Choiromyces venosus 120613-1 TaxID=1336337 RepID=A0A3N4IZ77_9PEZI|nr:hypothetical protein L873DRAFT_1821373 [Choiromyces venosus 120613-1]
MAALPLLMVTHKMVPKITLPLYLNNSKYTSNLSSGGEEMNKGIGKKKKRRQEDKRKVYHL